MEVYNVQCFNCIHLNEDMTCAAFPDGIPDDILNYSFVHDKKHPDQDNDILFERVEE